LQVAEARGQVDLFYFDAAGFNLTPCVPYAWQPPGVTYELPSGGRQRLNVLGLLNRANEAYFYPHIALLFYLCKFYYNCSKYFQFYWRA
jgi:hypothetical protein